MTPPDLLELKQLRHNAELDYIQKRRDGTDWRRAWRTRDRWFDRWGGWSDGIFTDLQGKIGAEAVAKYAVKESGGFRKAEQDPFWRKIRAYISGAAPVGWIKGAVRAYVALGLDTGKDAGQTALDALGIDQEFAWAHPRAMGRDIYAVRGSKVIQNAYGSHLDKLTNIVVDATSPARPKTIQEVTAAIRQEWPALAKWQAERIARTETAAVWETTNMNVMRANGITRFEWIVATGPSIGTTTEPVDDHCLRRAAKSPYTVAKLEAAGGMPPAHPNCRCTLIPVLTNEDGSPWLPPMEPWTGGTLNTKPIAAPDVG